jgi:preprotein translocase subunit SecE
MNTKASNLTTGTSGADMAKYALALLVAAAGVAAYYLMPTWPTPVRGLVVALGLAAAIAVMSFTALGGRGREFFSESLFELRKVVWPTRQEATRITGVVLLVVLVISLILFLMDLVIQWGIHALLSN